MLQRYVRMEEFIRSTHPHLDFEALFEEESHSNTGAPNAPPLGDMAQTDEEGEIRIELEEEEEDNYEEEEAILNTHPPLKIRNEISGDGMTSLPSIQGVQRGLIPVSSMLCSDDQEAIDDRSIPARLDAMTSSGPTFFRLDKKSYPNSQSDLAGSILLELASGDFHGQQYLSKLPRSD